MFITLIYADRSGMADYILVFELPQEDVNKLENAAASHPPERAVNPSKYWNLPFDVFDGE